MARRRPLTRSETMSRIRGSDTGPEMAIRRRLWTAGFRYRVALRIPEGGRADIAVPRLRLAVFIDGCFWHNCPLHGVRPKTNVDFWRRKLDGNRQRDARQTRALVASGWTVLRFWEHRVDADPDGVADEIMSFITTKGLTNETAD